MAISGHNTSWWWRYGQPQGGPVIAVGLPRSVLDRYWADVQQIAALGSDGAIIDPQEQGNVIWLRRDQKIPWEAKLQPSI